MQMIIDILMAAAILALAVKLHEVNHKTDKLRADTVDSLTAVTNHLRKVVHNGNR